MAVVTRGFHGRRGKDADLPPGQYLTRDFPVLSAGPTPTVPLESWDFAITSEVGQQWSWTWSQLLALPSETPTVDLHCVTRWSKLGTHWRGVSLDVLFENVETAADFTMVRSHGGYTTNVPLEDLLQGRAWVVYEYEGDPLEPTHGGPARLLVPHLYLWKSAKWVRGIQLMVQEDAGFWEGLGYHMNGDPWREQRYDGD